MHPTRPLGSASTSLSLRSRGSCSVSFGASQSSRLFDSLCGSGATSASSSTVSSTPSRAARQLKLQAIRKSVSTPSDSLRSAYPEYSFNSVSSSASTQSKDVRTLNHFSTLGISVAEEDPTTMSGCPLLEAVEKGLTPVVDFLLTRGASPDSCDDRADTCLHIAVKYNHVETLGLLLNWDADVNALNADGISPLTLAAQFNYIDLMKTLVLHGARLDEADDETPLMRALGSCQLDAARYLLESGAGTDVRRRNSFTALMTAVLNGDAPAVELLSLFGAQLTLDEADIILQSYDA